MLEAIRASGVHNVTAVVTRWFGGVLLGTGGLVRAYSGAVSEALGATVNYDAKTRSIDILLDDKQVIMQINLKVMIVNGEKVNLAVAPLIKNGRTFIPFRAIAEAFGCDVKWASETKEVVITRLWY